MDTVRLKQLRLEVKRLIAAEKDLLTLGDSKSGIKLDQLESWYKELGKLVTQNNHSLKLSFTSRGTGHAWTVAAQKRNDQFRKVQELAQQVLSVQIFTEEANVTD